LVQVLVIGQHEPIEEPIMMFFEDQTLGRIHEPGVSYEDGDDCSYYTNQPAPGQWVAIGITPLNETSGESPTLLVGTGRTELAAIRALHRRCQQRSMAETH
jgi:hypothetical protein